jgi:hypothetical protein
MFQVPQPNTARNYLLTHSWPNNLVLCKKVVNARSQSDPFVKRFLQKLKFYIPHYKHFYVIMYKYFQIPVAARSKEWVCDHSIVEIAGSNHAGDTDVCLL